MVVPLLLEKIEGFKRRLDSSEVVTQTGRQKKVKTRNPKKAEWVPTEETRYRNTEW